MSYRADKKKEPQVCPECSMNDFSFISPGKRDKLRARMKRLGVREEDITERFLRSGGPGGQHVNKVSTCVYLKHVPTGIEVKCASERYQSINRFLARQSLLDKIEDKIKKQHLAEMQKRAKLRRE